MWFTLTVDDFGIKYIGKQNALHLINVLKSHYDMETDWTGGLYCGITLEWNYEQRYVDISMPNYVKKKLIEYEHIAPKISLLLPLSISQILISMAIILTKSHIAESPLLNPSDKKVHDKY